VAEYSKFRANILASLRATLVRSEGVGEGEGEVGVRVWRGGGGGGGRPKFEGLLNEGLLNEVGT